MRNLFRKPWISVLIFSTYPILMIVSENVSEVIPKDVVFPLLLSIFTSFFIYFFLSLITKNQKKSSLFVIILLIFFFYYGHVFYTFISDIIINDTTIGRHRFFLPFWCLLFFLITILLIKTKKPLDPIIVFLNYIFSLLLFFILISILSFGKFLSMSLPTLNEQPLIIDNYSSSDVEIDEKARNNEDYPDIYYIILDGYASQDTLTNLYNYDNESFYEKLSDKGFYIAKNSISNYSNTLLSLTSSLNMEYLDKEKKVYQIKSNNSLVNSRVAKLLMSNGYKYITFESGYSVSEGSSIADLNVSCSPFSEFDFLLIKASILSPFSIYGSIQARILCQFESIKKIASNGSDFIFAHIVAPHPPFIFDKNGGNIIIPKISSLVSNDNAWADQKAYIEQLQFVNFKTLELVDSIKNKYDKDNFIIIIQSDHGPASLGNELMSNPSDNLIKERMGILNSYYVPREFETSLYEKITPVNSFRIILSELFNMDLPILKDKSFFTSYRNSTLQINKQQKIIFTDVTDISRY